MWRTSKNRAAKAILLLAVVAAAGCTFKSLKPEVNLAPPETYRSVVVGEVTVADKLAEGLVPHFRVGLVERLQAAKAFEAVLDGPGAAPIERAIVLSGSIDQVDKGSAAKRMLIGFGAGKARVSGTFEIKDHSGTTLARFSARESYAGGAGIGGIGMLDMEDLTRRFGASVADATTKWSKGEKLE